jgi:uncharacterized membrane protein
LGFLVKKLRLAHVAFVATVAIKGIDGVIETLLGLLILVVGPDKLFLIVLHFTTPELRNNPDSHVAKAVQSGAAGLTAIGAFAIFYLLIHGVLKAGIAINLLRGNRWIFAPAVLILGGFVVYLGYRTAQHWSAWSLSFALFDLFTLALVINEWRQPKTR